MCWHVLCHAVCASDSATPPTRLPLCSLQTLLLVLLLLHACNELGTCSCLRTHHMGRLHGLSLSSASSDINVDSCKACNKEGSRDGRRTAIKTACCAASTPWLLQFSGRALYTTGRVGAVQACSIYLQDWSGPTIYLPDKNF